MDEQTKYLYSASNLRDVSSSRSADIQPQLFISCEHEIMVFPLCGKQIFGRPSDSSLPEIMLNNKYISRQHGIFETTEDSITYTAGNTTNPTIFNRRILTPGEKISLFDGDELAVSSGDKENEFDIILVCATSERRIGIWRNLMAASLDPLTGLQKRTAFQVSYLQQINKKPDADQCLFVMEIDFFNKLVQNYGQPAANGAVTFVVKHFINICEDRGILCYWAENKLVGTIMSSARGTYFIM